MDDLAWARALHVVAVLHWIGGVLFVTLVILEGRGEPGSILDHFRAVERRFAPQARLSVLIAGLSGIWLVARLDLWWRFAEPSTFWWMWAMVVVWTLFAIALYLAEPLFLHDWFDRLARLDPQRALTLARRFHRVLAGLALLAVAGTVAGVHG